MTAPLPNLEHERAIRQARAALARAARLLKDYHLTPAAPVVVSMAAARRRLRQVPAFALVGLRYLREHVIAATAVGATAAGLAAGTVVALQPPSWMSAQSLPSQNPPAAVGGGVPGGVHHSRTAGVIPVSTSPARTAPKENNVSHEPSREPDPSPAPAPGASTPEPSPGSSSPAAGASSSSPAPIISASASVGPSGSAICLGVLVLGVCVTL